MGNELPPQQLGIRASSSMLPSKNFEASVLRFVSSSLFDRVFKQGMDLVEDTAAYLDGPGREDSKSLSRSAALAYAGESMRLTTRLMQVASWLLVQRAIEEGEMTPYDALDDKYRLGAREVCRGESFNPYDALPVRLKALLLQSEQVYEQVCRLDEQLYCHGERENTLDSQRNLLEEVFGGEHKLDI